jgi:hypothetical protein
MSFKFEKGDRQLIIAVIIWLIFSSSVFYFRFHEDFGEMTLLSMIVSIILCFGFCGFYVIFSYFIWILTLNAIVRIASSGNSGGIFDPLTEERNWSVKEILFHFFIGLPIGGILQFFILRIFDIL